MSKKPHFGSIVGTRNGDPAVRRECELKLLDESELSPLPAEPVTEQNIRGLTGDIAAMKHGINAGGFPGKYPRGYAIAHHQVARRHTALFVLRSDVAKAAFEGRDVILNPKVVGRSGELIVAREGCLSHPYRPTRRTERWQKIRLTFDTVSGGKMVPAQVDLFGTAAQIVQHEMDHLAGRSIWRDV